MDYNIILECDENILKLSGSESIKGKCQVIIFCISVSCGDGGMAWQLRILAALESEVYTEGIERKWKRKKQIMDPGR